MANFFIGAAILWPAIIVVLVHLMFCIAHYSKSEEVKVFWAEHGRPPKEIVFPYVIAFLQITAFMLWIYS